MAKKKIKNLFYTLVEIMKVKATYYIIFGERSNGKTFSVLELIVKRYCETGKQGALLRRFREDFVGKRGHDLFLPLQSAGIIEKYSDKWTHVYYYGSMWYLCRYEDTEKGERIRITDDTPFMYGFSISSWEHDKGTRYPDITTILFDEFITRGGYLKDEFVLFMNCLSTIIGMRDDVEIFMCGNTVNRYCPYFAEMGLKHISKMQQGDIDVYEIPSAGTVIAVEYCATQFKKGKPSNKYFAFDNKKLQMITHGKWEIDIYPHCPCKYTPQDILFTYFIIFENTILQCEIVCKDNNYFTYIHEKTTPLQNENRDLIYSTAFDPRPNWRRKITNPILDIEKKIARFYAEDKIYYQDNEIGEIVRNYLMWCGKVL